MLYSSHYIKSSCTNTLCLSVPAGFHPLHQCCLNNRNLICKILRGALPDLSSICPTSGQAKVFFPLTPWCGHLKAWNLSWTQPMKTSLQEVLAQQFLKTLSDRSCLTGESLQTLPCSNQRWMRPLVIIAHCGLDTLLESVAWLWDNVKILLLCL